MTYATFGTFCKYQDEIIMYLTILQIYSLQTGNL